MDVRLATDCGGVTQLLGDFRNHGIYLAYRPSAARKGVFLQLGERSERRVPSTKVLGGEVAARYGAQILIHVGRADGPARPAFVDILKQLLPGQVTKPS